MVRIGRGRQESFEGRFARGAASDDHTDIADGNRRAHLFRFKRFASIDKKIPRKSQPPENKVAAVRPVKLN